MKKLNSDEVKQIELNILIEFSKFCDSNNLRYYLACGTLIGAIRHKGFIPWDDDIDVYMPRPDYERFIKIFQNKGNFKIQSNRLGNLTRPYSRIVDISTVIERQYTESDTNKNLWIDIFPVDGLPVNLKEVKDMYGKCVFYRNILWLTECKLGQGTTILKRYAKYILKPLALVYSASRCLKNMEKLAAKYQYDKSKYVGMIIYGDYGTGERMLKTEFEKSVEVEFEGHTFKTFSCWNSYLTNVYGDYMKLPPVEKRTVHITNAFKINDTQN